MSDDTPPALTFRSEGREVVVHLDSPGNTAWASVRDIADLFGCTTQNVEHHIKQAYRDDEVDEIGTTKSHLVVRREGDRDVQRAVTQYNLDTYT